jgi:diacylglycerol O-acyltransferase / wax synthase
LAENRFAVLTVFHHAAVDGASGMELLTLMLDEHPEGREIPPPAEPWQPDRAPSDLGLLARTSLGLVRKPARAVLLGAQTARELGQATRNPALIATASQVRRSLRGPLGSVLNLGRSRGEDRDPPPRLPAVLPPRTPFNRPIGPHRKLAIGSASLEVAKAIKNAYEVTVNDVVLAVCAGGLRTWLARHDALPDDPLVALVPVSIRTGKETDRWTNRVSMLSTVLPTDEPDPVKRLLQVHDSMASSKDVFRALPAERLTDFAEFPPPAVFARAMRLSARLHLGSRLVPGNVVISNVPGPRRPLYAARGARLEHYFPVSVITEGQGLNITVQSYLGRLDFGLLSDPDLVPDLDAMLEAILADLDVLFRTAGSTAQRGRQTRDGGAAARTPATPRSGGRT